MSHLRLESFDLAPSEEKTFEGSGWRFICVGGEACYWISGRGAMDLGRGEVVALLPLAAGRLRASRLGATTLHCFRFNPGLAGHLLAPWEQSRFEILAQDAAHAVKRYAFDSPGAALWRRSLEARQDPNSMLSRIERLHVVAVLLQEDFQKTQPPSRSVLSSRQKLRLLLDETPESELIKLGLDQLANHCGVSITQVKRSFRSLLGESLAEMQKRIRLKHARAVLMETSRTMESVALEAGFKDAGRFSEAFQKEFSQPPALLRRSSSPRRSKEGKQDKTSAASL